MRKALVVGIDYYAGAGNLHGCVNDADQIRTVLERHGDESVNFDVKLLSGTGPANTVSRQALKQSIRELYEGEADIALLYFAGHGHIEDTGGYLVASDSLTGDDGVPLSEVLTLANSSRAKNRLVVLDSCHSGIAGASPSSPQNSDLSEGMTILTASTAEQYATEENGAGVFTTLLVDALAGGGANLVGDITPGSAYAHIDQSLGPWQQRPVFKTNVKSFVSLRRVPPPIALADLHRISTLFPYPACSLPLDPSFEPEGPCPDLEKTEIFAVLQKYARVNLVVPVDAPHMYHAAMGGKSCKLTVLGQHYRKLVERGRI